MITRSMRLSVGGCDASFNDGEMTRAVRECLRVTDITLGGCDAVARMRTDTIAREITDILFGSKKIRIGPGPTDMQRRAMEERIARYVDAGKPIEISTMWGGLKGYGQTETRRAADLGDLLGLRRFEDLHCQILPIYPPGLKVTLIREDVTEHIMTMNIPNLPQLIEKYSTSLDNTCRIFGISDHISFVDESALLASNGVAPHEFIARANENAKAFFEYWVASSMEPDVGRWESLPQYKSLQELGWKGIIPEVTRQHYLERVGTEHPGASVDEKTMIICRYFGASLARYQFGIFRGSAKDVEGNVIDPLKASFIPYPPGTDSSLSSCRMEYKLKDSRTSKNFIPPLVGVSFFVASEGFYVPRIVGLRTYRNIPREAVEPLDIHIECEERQMEQRIAADVLSPSFRI